MKKRVAILKGGNSEEREVSLSTETPPSKIATLFFITINKSKLK